MDSDVIKICVDIPGKKYPIFIGSGISSDIESVLKEISFVGKKRFFVTNDRFFSLYSGMFSGAENVSVIKDGEENKTVENWYALVDDLIRKGINRDSVVIVVGGGVTGDLGAFAASVVLRGIKFIQMPTTLLSMVDSSVGGKTGFNHPMGKNLVGVFNQPEAVIIDIDFLKTLDDIDILNGAGEIVKHSYISENTVLKGLTENFNFFEGTKKGDSVISKIVAENVKIKAAVVAKDEKESGLRQILNYGHTFGHVIESVGNYKTVPHGVAILAGILAACDFSVKEGICEKNFADNQRFLINELLKDRTYFLPLTRSDFDTIIMRDKKVKNGKLTLVLPRSQGDFVFFKTDNLDSVYQSLKTVLSGLGWI